MEHNALILNNYVNKIVQNRDEKNNYLYTVALSLSIKKYIFVFLPQILLLNTSLEFSKIDKNFITKLKILINIFFGVIRTFFLRRCSGLIGDATELNGVQ